MYINNCIYIYIYIYIYGRPASQDPLGPAAVARPDFARPAKRSTRLLSLSVVRTIIVIIVIIRFCFSGVRFPRERELPEVRPLEELGLKYYYHSIL